MARQQYRTEIRILSDVLYVVMNHGRSGAIISSIGREANLSHDVAIEKCKRLEEAGLLEPFNDGRNRTFIVTEKGIHFYEQLEKFLEIVNEVKIRC